jgi:hypothetical protein
MVATTSLFMNAQSGKQGIGAGQSQKTGHRTGSDYFLSPFCLPLLRASHVRAKEGSIIHQIKPVFTRKSSHDSDRPAALSLARPVEM